MSSPRNIESPDNTVDVTDLTNSPITKMANLAKTSPPTIPSALTLPFMAPDETALFSYKTPAIITFTPKLERGANEWVNEQDTFFVLQRYHNFRKTAPAPNLVLKCNINNLEHLFSLAKEISGTNLTVLQLGSICAQPADSGADPATRFNNANIPTLEAVDAGYYLAGEIQLYAILPSYLDTVALSTPTQESALQKEQSSS
jgi:hypothetical protein